MRFLKERYERRKKYFDNLEKFLLKEIKKIVGREVQDAEIYLYGSLIEGEYSIGLSDIDVAVVTDTFKDREKKLSMFGTLTKTFIDSPFEFHTLTKEQWETYRRFVKKYKKIA